MSMTTRDWALQWRRAGRELARIKREELRAFDYQQNLERINALLEAARATGIVRRTSGLVEQQRLFAKLRARR
jgi:hypothetical protein